MLRSDAPFSIIFPYLLDIASRMCIIEPGDANSRKYFSRLCNERRLPLYGSHGSDMKKAKILVVGSMNMDLITSGDRFVKSGETIYGTAFSTAPGGKGANQAIQAARLSAEVTMVGKIGSDAFGKELLKSANDSGVDTSNVIVDESVPTGIADIQLCKTESGTLNRIIIVPGANGAITVSDISFLEENIKKYDMVILQHEIPQEINVAVAGYAAAAGVEVMLNPAPAAKIPDALMKNLTYISPNEHEAAELTGVCAGSENELKKIISAFSGLGVKNTLITLGKAGAVLGNGDKYLRCTAVDYRPVVDPTAAGDSFIAAFCVAHSVGLEASDSLYFASVVAAVTVSRMGAQPSLPTLDEALSALSGVCGDKEKESRIFSAFGR